MNSKVKCAPGLLGRKVGMTRIFSEGGASIPVTVIDAGGNRVVQQKTRERDGYSALQVAFGKRKASRVSKPQAGHFAKAGVQSGHVLCEFRVDADLASDYAPGAALSVDTFTVGQKVDVTGVSKGKGYSGAIKRHNFSSNRQSHGNSVSHRAPGSIGMAQDPGRVFPGKRMSGQYGNVRRTVQNLEVVRVDSERQLLLICGALPGANGSDVVIRPAVKLIAAEDK